MDLFKKKTPADLMKEQTRSLRKAQRDMDRDKRDIEKQEKQLELDIKKAAKAGDKQLCTILAKQLVNLRKQKTRSYAASSKIQSVGVQTKMMQSSAKMANVMGTTAKTMGSVNKQINPAAVAKTMQDFEKENMKMGMTDELLEDTLESVLDESGDEEEQDAIVNQVLDEIGIETIGKLTKAPSAGSNKLGESSRAATTTDEDLEKQLARLKAL